jgi:hypothetical protein
MAALTKKATPLRIPIRMDEELEVKYWTKHLRVGREELHRAVDKVGNSAAAVRKELGTVRKRSGQPITCRVSQEIQHPYI